MANEAARCSLFCFYIKPQQEINGDILLRCCSLFCFYIKPQLPEFVERYFGVVPYSVSTSNHNIHTTVRNAHVVVPYSVSTSNHNAGSIIRLFPASYIALAINKMDFNHPAKCV